MRGHYGHHGAIQAGARPLMNTNRKSRPTLTKQRLAREIGRRTRLSNKITEAALEALIAIVSEQLAAGGRVEIANFLTLAVKPRKRIAPESAFWHTSTSIKCVYFVLHCKPGKRLHAQLRTLTDTQSQYSGNE